MSEYPIPEERFGWPPGLRCEWTGWHWRLVLADDDVPDYDALGPPGTVWTFDQATALEHCQGGVIASAIKWVARVPLIDGIGHWVVPDTWESTMDWLRATINADLSGGETMQHTFSIVHPDESALPEDAAALGAIADLVKNQWSTFLDTAPPLITAVKTFFHTSTVFTGVTVQHLRQTVPFVNGGNNNGKVSQVGPTVVSAPLNKAGTSGADQLPHEVAMAVTLRTRAPQAGGVSHGRRNRGRVYLGGFSSAIMGADGLFENLKADGIAKALGEAFIAPLYDDHDLQVTVISKVGLIGHQVTQTESGLVPDVQRRRRRSLPESRTTAWAIP